jgi:hypothetical protein
VAVDVNDAETDLTFFRIQERVQQFEQVIEDEVQHAFHFGVDKHENVGLRADRLRAVAIASKLSDEGLQLCLHVVGSS